MSGTVGICHRHAPTAGEGRTEVAHWPETDGNEGCAEGTPTAAAAGPMIRCRTCLFWDSPADGGIHPVDQRDQLKQWWAQAGHCVRFAPLPGSNPGNRAQWLATHAHDGCGDGEAAEPA